MILKLSSEEAPAETSSLKLLKLPAKINLEAGDELIIRGLESDQAVLCTNQHTFKVSNQFISNALIPSILPREQSDAVVDLSLEQAYQGEAFALGILDSMWELQQILPQVERLRIALIRNCLSFDQLTALLNGDPSIDGESCPPGAEMASICDTVQASRREIEFCLEMWHAIEIQEKWYSLDIAAVQELLTMFVLELRSLGLFESQFSVDQLSGMLHESGILGNRIILAYLLRRFCNDELDGMWSIDSEKCYLFFGMIIMKRVKRAPLSHFITSWQADLEQLTGESVEINPDHIISLKSKGIALVEKEIVGYTGQICDMIEYVNSSEMPIEPSLRFQALFDKRSQWTYAEIRHYLMDVARTALPGNLDRNSETVIKDTLDQMISKNCKILTISNERICRPKNK